MVETDIPDENAADEQRLVISSDDLQDPSVDNRVNELREAATPPLVQSVGAPGVANLASSQAWWRGTIATLGLAGLIGGFVGFVASELLMGGDGEGASVTGNIGLETAIWVALFAVGLGATMAAWEGIEMGSGAKVRQALAKNLPPVIAAGAISGFIAQTAIYEPILDSAFERAISAGSLAEAESIMMSAIRFGRALGFMVVGAAIGAALGLGARASQKVLNGAMGGAIGGFIGGFVFDAVGEALGAQTGAFSRAVVLVLTGLVIGVAIGLIENVRKDHWLEIVSGGMAGKQFILYHDETVLGSDPSCAITLIKDPQIAPQHLAIRQTASGATATALDATRPILVNGQPAQAQELGDGDLVQVGQTVLRYGQKDQAVPTLAAPAH